MKDFLVYTALRILMFVVCYAVFAGLWTLIWGDSGAAYIWPFVAAAVVSSLLALKYLQGPRERFARRVEERAARATAKFEEMRSREDADQGA
ncbi:DUF4229 domain-containing protein [Nocardioides terrisoli]|uniref:DUF4229 domain-containing protein n=1 Tax=Nocardioides terrisoli TaxID=3388267 RepID=UPI00287B661F|nr:DUF4229 domain-containing protein [Nocardioides marmorisolisilvae]